MTLEQPTICNACGEFWDEAGWVSCPRCQVTELREENERMRVAIARWADAEPPCHCGELAPGPCCHACRVDRELRALLTPCDSTKGKEQ